MKVVLKGITRHGKNRIKENGAEYQLFNVSQKVAFSPLKGIWLNVNTKHRVVGGEVHDIRTVKLTDDKNFHVTIVDALTEDQIQNGLDNQGFTVGYLLEDYDVLTEGEFIEKMLVEDFRYQVLFWWDAILEEYEQFDLSEKYFPGNNISDEEKIFIFLREKLAQK